jgi:CubicO group peptidase (beta-lactamase class C family)
MTPGSPLVSRMNRSNVVRDEHCGVTGIEMEKKFVRCLLLSVLAVAAGRSGAQGTAERPPWAAEVDALFAAWDRPDSPGCALGVIQDGKLAYARGYGQASLEHAVPITSRTVFDVGSTSKQFTAASIGLLVQDGKLGVEDEIHDWVSELAPWDETVTLDHLLHHTSGIPDYLGLLFRSGADEADLTTPAQALEHLAKVQKLAFAPGSRFEYSNSNYFLLSLVIARAAGRPFQDFARERLFEPLGMTSTLLMHDHALVVPHRATGYGKRDGGGFGVAMSDFEQLGDGAVQTSVEDLVRWDSNFYSWEVGGEALRAFLHGTAALNDGKPNQYARGLIVDELRGLPRVSHGGAWAGFRAQLMRFPEQKTSFVCLANLADVDPSGLCEQVAAVVLGGKMRGER